jgi:hypothetical protein
MLYRKKLKRKRSNSEKNYKMKRHLKHRKKENIAKKRLIKNHLLKKMENKLLTKKKRKCKSASFLFNKENMLILEETIYKKLESKSLQLRCG